MKNYWSKKEFQRMLDLCEFSKDNETSFGYHYEDESVCIDFYQSNTGINIVEQFCVFKMGIWFDIVPAEFQIKMMFNKLNETNFEPREEEEEEEDAPIVDLYFENGVNRQDFF